MSPASYQAAPPRDADGLATFRRSVLPTHQSGKRESNPAPQPWQGCALPTELFPQTATTPGSRLSTRALHQPRHSSRQVTNTTVIRVLHTVTDRKSVV